MNLYSYDYKYYIPRMTLRETLPVIPQESLVTVMSIGSNTFLIDCVKLTSSMELPVSGRPSQVYVYYACMLKAGHVTLENLQSTSGVLCLGSVHVALVKLPKLSYSTTKNPFAVGVS